MMKLASICWFVGGVLLTGEQQAFASAGPFALDPAIIRWTQNEDKNADFLHVLDRVNQQVGHSFAAGDFALMEDRKLAFSRYQRYEQMVAGMPIEKMAIRIWSSLDTHETLQVEAKVQVPTDDMKKMRLTLNFAGKVSEESLLKIVRAEVAQSDDPLIRNLKIKDAFIGTEPASVVRVTSAHGYQTIAVSKLTRKLIRHERSPFPESDYRSLKAKVFPIYEEAEKTGEILNRTDAVLAHVKKMTAVASGDIYASLRKQKYLEEMYSPLLGETASGRAKGYWAMSYVKDQAAQLRKALPLELNNFAHGLLLEGKYATINIHPDAFKAFAGVQFAATPSAAFFPNWVETLVNQVSQSEMIPMQAVSGKPLFSAQELLDRPARKLPDNDAATYMNDGFDEIQVYYAINTLMDQLRARGFTDPELSARPFSAFLFNPDIVYRDNAFYTDDTINFTTYSPGKINMARDNSTIWHELGHGVMDRLMGDQITLADTGGLSEGMADFVAAMIVQAMTEGAPFPGSQDFRIINKTGFNLTNESHDDGEACGGAMKDFMDVVIAQNGKKGLDQVSDLILESMRLTRDHPALTANDWFDHIFFADSLGRVGLRQPGELKALLEKALSGRNFNLDHSPVATFSLVDEADQHEISTGAVGTRYRPTVIRLEPTAKASLQLQVKVQNSKAYRFQFPLTVKASFNGGALQGPAHFEGEEKGAATVVLQSETDLAHFKLAVTGTCDSKNRDDGSCVDYVSVQLWDAADTAPRAKKRFYVQVKSVVDSKK